MNVLLVRLLTGLVRTGTLKVTGPDGIVHDFGDGTGIPAQFHIKSRRAEMAITFDPMLALPEAYMNGEVDIPGGVLSLMRVVFQNLENAGIDTIWTRALDGLRLSFRRLQQINTAARARRNVERHYDLSTELYKLFLDRDMQYSCAYFETPDATLEDAQAAKKRHIVAKLALKQGQRVLDIGCGWGGMGLFIADMFGADVLGVTLSTEQQAVAVERARECGLVDAGAVRGEGLPRSERALRSHRLGRNVRACGYQPLQHLFRQGGASSRGRRRDAAAHDRTLWPAVLHERICSEIHLSWRLHTRTFRDHYLRSRMQASWSRMSKCCGFIMRKLSSIGASALRKIAIERKPFMMSGFAECGNSTSRLRKLPSVGRIW